MLHWIGPSRSAGYVHRRVPTGKQAYLRFALVCLIAVCVLPGDHSYSQSATNKAASPAAVRYIENETWAWVPNSFPHGLDVLEVYVDRPGHHPLALLTHGTSGAERERELVTPWSQLDQALWFARRGYVAIVIVRKGYGRSGGEQDGRHGGCKPRGSFREAGEASAEDLRAVAQWATHLPEVDGSTLVSAGVSTGGFAQAALTENPPKGLKAAISFAGGRGGDGKEHDCNLVGVVAAFHEFGKGAAKHGTVPMLWIYAQNDHWFPPAMAVQFEEAYRRGGGSVQFVMAQPDGDDGHHLFRHVDVWSSAVEEFLRSHDLLPLGDEVLPSPPAPDFPPPPGLHEHSQETWKRYLILGPYKAFAMAADGNCGSATGKFDQDLADQEAMDRCRKAAGPGVGCKIVARTAMTNANPK